MNGLVCKRWESDRGSLERGKIANGGAFGACRIGGKRRRARAAQRGDAKLESRAQQVRTEGAVVDDAD